ncbi:uncharacterized protein LOC111718132 [Eurytemora carolleeae]|uniref:uncharacterized protein LOC111718132 n=1 Tax=Eurytemora carolleeae TaxID=1294199 RepID=UPI000C762921|nr:uncharacterized protein LOC111718132 [Eurytemora carolleeae]|eukprot:XP_023349411.1 uncharacterized protein LOC111718132 [Eurytemora affinis]
MSRLDFLNYLDQHGLNSIIEYLVIRFLDTRSILKLSQVCKDWRRLLDTPYIWRSLAHREGFVSCDCTAAPEVPDLSWISTKHAGYLLEPRCTWSEYVGYRIRLRRNYRTGNYETKILNPTQVLEDELACSFDCDGKHLVVGTSKGRILLWNLSSGVEAVQQTFMFSAKINKVFLRANCIIVLQQGMLFYLRILAEHFDSIYTLHLGVTGLGLSVTSQFGQIAYGYKGDTCVPVLDIESGVETQWIFLEDGYFLETILLSHIQSSKHTIFISAYTTSGEGNVESRDGFVYSSISGDILFQFNISSLIDTRYTANLLFYDGGIYLEGQLYGSDYPLETVWRVWDTQGNLLLDYIFQSDFGMVLTGNNSENNETNLHLTASGYSYLTYCSLLKNHLVFSQKEHKGISLNVYQIKESKQQEPNPSPGCLSVSRLWRSMQYIENSSIFGENLPCIQVPESDTVLSMSSNYRGLVIRDLYTGVKLAQIPAQGKYSRVWAREGMVLLLNGGPLGPAQLLYFG